MEESFRVFTNYGSCLLLIYGRKKRIIGRKKLVFTENDDELGIDHPFCALAKFKNMFWEWNKLKSLKNTYLFSLFFSLFILIQTFLLTLSVSLLLPKPVLAVDFKPIYTTEDGGFDSIFRIAAADLCSAGSDQLVALGRNYIENTAVLKVYSWSGAAWEGIWESGNLIEEKSPVFMAVGRPNASGKKMIMIMTNHRLDLFAYSAEGFTLTSQIYHTLLPQEINVADVNGDGIDELLVARVGEIHPASLDMVVEVYALVENVEGNTSLHKMGGSPLCGNIRAMTGGDIDGDGQEEVLIGTGLGGKTGAFSLLKWTSRELTTAGLITSPLSTVPYGLENGFLHGVDRERVVVTADGWGRISLFTFADWQFTLCREKISLNSALVSVALADFNGDGLSDLAVAGYPAKLFLLTGDSRQESIDEVRGITDEDLE